MRDQPTTPGQLAAFVAKLNDFLATLEAHEQEWLLALLTRPTGGEDVQGYLLSTLPFSLALAPQDPTAFGRTLPNGRTDVIKVMGNTKWEDIELK